MNPAYPGGAGHTLALDGDRLLASARTRWASLSLCPSYLRYPPAYPGGAGHSTPSGAAQPRELDQQHGGEW
jgi:hypothetical protein